jgi:hypothetical protein
MAQTHVTVAQKNDLSTVVERDVAVFCENTHCKSLLPQSNCHVYVGSGTCSSVGGTKNASNRSLKSAMRVYLAVPTYLAGGAPRLVCFAYTWYFDWCVSEALRQD